LLATDEIRHRAALDALLNQLAKLLAHVLLHNFVVARVKLDAPAAERVSEQDLRIESGQLGLFLREILFRPVEEAPDRPGLIDCHDGDSVYSVAAIVYVSRWAVQRET